jgi:hypothetical protein
MSPTYVDVNTYAGANTGNCWQFPIARTCGTRAAGIDTATTKFATRVARKLWLPTFPVVQLVVLIDLPKLETSGDERWAMRLSWADL